MRKFSAPLSALAIAFLAACSTGSESGSSGGQLFVRSCSLGCSDGSQGVQVSCQVQSTVQNTDISVLFSETVDINTVTSTTFRVVNVDNGTTPVGEYFLDPSDPRRVVFRPALTFDINGSPSFGFNINTPYQITIAGELHSSTGPFIRSTFGRANQSRLECTIVTTDQVTDPVPGPPVVEVYTDRVTAYNGSVPSEIDQVTNSFGTFDGFGTDGLEDNLVNGDNVLTDVFRESNIYFLFRDVMNPATLANPQTNASPFINLKSDEDGQLATTFDRSDSIPGVYQVSVDTENLQTLLTFNPNTALLSAGAGAPANPRVMVVDVPNSVVDLDGKPVTAANGGGLSLFVTELGQTTDITLPETGGETFSDTSLEDGNRSGGAWGTMSRLAPDVGGGSGRLGELVVTAGETVTLDTDSQGFPLNSGVANIIGNPDISGAYPVTAMVTDGVFEFSTLIVEPGGVLKFVGSNPARVLVRGVANITTGSVIDLSGNSAADHDSGVLQPKVELAAMAPIPPANGGEGGWGADKFDWDPVPPLNTTSVFVDLASSNATDIAEDFPERLTGENGQGVGRGAIGGGLGAPFFFTNWPSEDSLIINPMSVGVVGAHGANPPFNRNHDGFNCVVREVGASGSGGAYALPGGMGIAQSVPITATHPVGLSNHGPDVAGGSNAALSLATPSETNVGYARRTLDPAQGFLQGGSGGGGGGLHPYQSQSGIEFIDTTCSPSDDRSYEQWSDYSGARGGGGGGALHLVAGKSVQLNGQILLSGGDGGSSTGGTGLSSRAMPGGGGSGGALLLQGRSISVSPLPGRIDVDGGAGGEGVWNTGDIAGGDGSRGLVRVENSVGTLTHQLLAQSIRPYDGDNMAPFDDVDKSLDFLSVANGGFTLSESRPDSICASTSCWIELPTNFSVANFSEDGVELGWDMDIIWQNGGPEELISFRGPSTPFPSSFEDVNGNFLGNVGGTASPVVVRFQGARVNEPLSNPCNVSVSSASSPLQFGSLTPWVTHPAELNPFGPNVIRFVVIFDNTKDAGNSDTPGLVLDNVRGVTNLRIEAVAE